MAGSLLQSTQPTRTLAAACGLPLAAYRRDHVQHAVMRAMRRERIGDIAALVQLVDRDRAARTRLRRAIAVSATGLFRDPEQLRWIDSRVVTELARRPGHVRAWSAGCAAGEEAFTLAMMLEWHGLLGRSDVVGSDILEESLAEAEAGVVGGARIPAALRGQVAWDRRDLTAGAAPGGDFDLVLCRNLLSFLTPVAADAVARTLAPALAPGGVLVVARDERIEDAAALGLQSLGPTAYRRAA
jgi:chemotaxis methyl-accepting protein methylase